MVACITVKKAAILNKFDVCDFEEKVAASEYPKLNLRSLLQKNE